MKKLQYFILSLSILICIQIQAQKLEKVKSICVNIPMNQRATIAVSSFTNSSGSSQFKSEGLTDMLGNALFNSGCFAVLERKNMKEVISEQDFANSNRADSKTKVEIGKLKGAKMVIMGNVTEFKETEGGGAIGGYFKKAAGGVGATTAHLGIIIKIVDVKTGMLIESKSFDKKVTSVGLAAGGIIAGIPVGGLGFKSKAMQDATEQLIIDIVEYIASKKDYDANSQEIKNLNGENQISIELNQISYNDLNKLYKYLQTNTQFKDISKTLENKKGTVNLTSNLSVDKVADFILECKCDIKLEITSVNDNLIVAKVEK